MNFLILPRRMAQNALCNLIIILPLTLNHKKKIDIWQILKASTIGTLLVWSHKIFIMLHEAYPSQTLFFCFSLSFSVSLRKELWDLHVLSLYFNYLFDHPMTMMVFQCLVYNINLSLDNNNCLYQIDGNRLVDLDIV